jgi:uncharacterized protein (TIGR03067 family)
MLLPFISNEGLECGIAHIQLQGVRNARLVFLFGKEWPPEEMRKATVTIGGDYLMASGDEQLLIMSYKLNRAAGPNAIDFRLLGYTLLGIFEIKNDMLKICWAHRGEPRPSKIPSEPTGGTSVLILTRKLKASNENCARWLETFLRARPGNTD